MSSRLGAAPDFLVLMATHNGEQWVEQQLQSVLVQQDVGLRVRVSDDASTDRTGALLRNAAQRDARITLLSEMAPSGSACANFLRLIRSVDPARDVDFTHVALCDQDDIWHRDKLNRAATHMTQTGADLYSSATTALWPSGKVKNLRQCAVPTRADYLFEGAGQGCTFVLSRALFLQIRAAVLDESALLSSIHYHDWLIYALARSRGHRWFHDPVPTMVYRQHASNDTGARDSLDGIRLRFDRISTGWYRKQVKNMLTVCIHVSPRHEATTEVAALMDGAHISMWGKLRWCRFLLTRSRRRLADRLVLAAFACLGRL